MPVSVYAETIVIKLSSGTGFFVSDDGYVITNNHVVAPCGKNIQVENAILRLPAKLIDNDTGDDLALLRIDRNSPGVAIFRSPDDPIKDKERIAVVGYPLAGRLTTQEGIVESTIGPRGEERLMQFSNLVKKGNSGGPLLDTSGRIVGVVMAKAKAMMYNEARGRKETVLETDVAITSNALLAFMRQNRVQPRFSFGGVALSVNNIQDRVRDSVVKVTCQVE